MSSSENGVIPKADAAMLLFAQNASTKVTLSPTTYGLTTGFATSLASATSGFQAAIAACGPFARNKTAVIATIMRKTSQRKEATSKETKGEDRSAVHCKIKRTAGSVSGAGERARIQAGFGGEV